MATAKRQRNCITRLIEDEARGPRPGRSSAQEIDDLKAALDDLTAKVNRLVAMQSETRRDDQ